MSLVDKIKEEILIPENPYPHIFPDMQDWPIVKLSHNRDNCIAETKEKAAARVRKLVGDKLSEEIALVIYQEGIRRRTDPWRIDLPDEDTFWKQMRRNLMRKSLDKDKKGDAVVQNNEQIMMEIIDRYADEIASDFQTSTFLFIRKASTMFFNRMLNTAAGKNWHRFWGTHHRLQERIKCKGEIESIRELMKTTTVILVPTHFSNLDSILIGWAIDSIGLPAFSYGAGLNLFNYSLAGFFMNRLGAYKVDRRKKNLIYLETLKAYSQNTIERGTNSLFFPGGTRARSGSLETDLKMGLLGTALEAQMAQSQRGEKNKIVIVPLVIGYHFVLEAESLIEEHLRRTGKELYLVDKDDLPGFWKTMKFVWQAFAKSAEIVLSFGKPIDVLGNFVDNQGNSYDKFGKLINVSDYFVSEGVIKPDAQRDAQYTKILAETLLARFKAENLVLTSHLVAFVAFNFLRALYPNLDLYGILRLPEHETVMDIQSVKSLVEQMKELLINYQKAGKLSVSEEILEKNAAEIIEHGISNLGVFHPTKALLLNDEGNLYSQNMKLLLYYHNRTLGYDLEKEITWLSKEDSAAVY